MKKICIVGGGTAGITVATRLLRSLRTGEAHISLFEPSQVHDYQPLWTLVGAGILSKEGTRRQARSVIPKQVEWIPQAVSQLQPDHNQLMTSDGKSYSYDYLIVCPGIQLHWEGVEGLSGQVGRNGICSNYAYESVDKTWEALRNFKGGRAIFTFPKGVVKCAGAPQKIMYLAEEHLCRSGVRQDSEVLYVAPGKAIFGVDYYRPALEAVVARKGIQTMFGWHLKGVDAPSKVAILENVESGEIRPLTFELLHVTPPQRAPEVVRENPQLSNEAGWLEVDKYTLQNARYPNVFGLGDASSLPTSKTGAAIRKQAPVLVANLLSLMRGKPLTKHYDVYASCPLLTGYSKTIMAEFNYEGQPTPTIPFLDPRKERRINYWLKRHGIPFLYWNYMLKGLA